MEPLVQEHNSHCAPMENSFTHFSLDCGEVSLGVLWTFIDEFNW